MYPPNVGTWVPLAPTPTLSNTLPFHPGSLIVCGSHVSTDVTYHPPTPHLSHLLFWCWTVYRLCLTSWAPDGETNTLSSRPPTSQYIRANSCVSVCVYTHNHGFLTWVIRAGVCPSSQWASASIHLEADRHGLSPQTDGLGWGGVITSWCKTLTHTHTHILNDYHMYIAPSTKTHYDASTRLLRWIGCWISVFILSLVYHHPGCYATVSARGTEGLNWIGITVCKPALISCCMQTNKLDWWRVNLMLFDEPRGKLNSQQCKSASARLLLVGSDSAPLKSCDCSLLLPDTIFLGHFPWRLISFWWLCWDVVMHMGEWLPLWPALSVSSSFTLFLFVSLSLFLTLTKNLYIWQRGIALIEPSMCADSVRDRRLLRWLLVLMDLLFLRGKYFDLSLFLFLQMMRTHTYMS